MMARSPIKKSLLAGVCAALLSAAALAQAVRFDIPEGQLKDALDAYAKQSGVRLIYIADDVRGVGSRGVQGQLPSEQALEQLLRGTGFVVERDESGAVAVVRSKTSATSVTSEVMETVSVFGRLDSDLAVGSKTGQSLRETPKTVSLVTRERIEEQNLSSLVDVLRQTNGVITNNYNAIDSWFFSRGYRVRTMQFDGGAPVMTGGYGFTLVPDMATYDHVEMLRGVDGMYSGAGDPGGVINLVRKRAKAVGQTSLLVSAGSWNYGRIDVDVTGPLTDDGRLRGRLAGTFQHRNYHYDHAESDKRIAFGTAEYDLTENTVLIGGFNYERRKEDAISAQGFPRYTDGGAVDLPIDASFSPDWAHWYFTSRELFTRVEHRYGDNGLLNFSATRLEQKSDNLIVTAIAFPGGVDRATGLGATALANGNQPDSSQDLLDLSANGTFQLFGREHRYTVGADYADIDAGRRKLLSTGATYAYPGTIPIPVGNFDPSLYPRPTLVQTGYYPQDGYTQQGYYATLGLQLAEPLRLTLGGRYGQYRVHSVFYSTTADGTRTSQPTVTRYDDEKFIPSAALTWDFADRWTAYASYAETFLIQAQLLQAPLPGTPLDPVTGTGAEVGVKGELNGVNLALAVYRVERSGQGVRDLDYPFVPGDNGSSCCYVADADIISEGLDVEASGTLLPGWQLTAGYTYNSNEYDGATSAYFSSGAASLKQTPKHMTKVWTTWQLPGQYSRWSTNLGVVAQSKTWVSGDARPAGSAVLVPTDFVQSGYAIWNASIKYRLSDHWSIGLYGDNLLDKKYYTLLGRTIANNTYGAPRNLVLTLRGTW